MACEHVTFEVTPVLPLQVTFESLVNQRHRYALPTEVTDNPAPMAIRKIRGTVRPRESPQDALWAPRLRRVPQGSRPPWNRRMRPLRRGWRAAAGVRKKEGV